LVSSGDDDINVSRIKREVAPMLRYAVSAALLITATPAHAAAPVSGRWYTGGQESIVEIGQCGATICGKVAKILKPDPKGPPVPIDSNNPDPALRKRPIQGLTILSGFKDAGKEWAGSIYDPRRGMTFKSTMVRLANGNLKVKGCWGFICRSEYFTPVK
jgi:uncharacterized protein (DUF2147 family)